MRLRSLLFAIVSLVLIHGGAATAQQRHGGSKVDEFDTGIENQMIAVEDANEATYAADRKSLSRDYGYRPKFKLVKKARIEFERGNVALGKNDFAGARQHFAAAVEAQPDFAVGHLNLGAAEMSLNQLQPAKREFEAAAKLDPRLDMAFQDIGTLEIRRGNFTAAEDELKTANRLAPKNLKTLTLLAYTQELNHEYDSAVASAKLVHVAKNHAGYALAHVIAASALQASGKTLDAIAEYQTFLKEDPNSPRAQEIRTTLRELGAAADQR